MMKQEDVLLHTTDVRTAERGAVVLQGRVDVSHQPGHLGSHAVLHSQRGVVQLVADQPLEEGQVQVVVLAQLVHGGGGPQLLVVADQDQVLAGLVKRRHHVGF